MFFENQHYRHAALAIAKTGGPVFPTGQPHTSPWTTTVGGQMAFGGWSPEGQERWKKMRDKVTGACQRPHVVQMEAECLARLRAKHGVDGEGRAAAATPASKRDKLPAAEESDNEFL